MSDKKLYKAIIWQERPDAIGERIELYAVDIFEAQKMIREKYGSTCTFSLTNDEDESRLR